jgi:hypothetical protein
LPRPSGERIMNDRLDPWAELDSFLAALAKELGGDAYAFYDSAYRQVLPFVENVHAIEKLGRVRDTLAERFGVDFLGRGTGRRYLHVQSPPSFVCEPVLGAYLLVVVLEAPPVEGSLILGLLEAVATQLAEMVRRLPPIDGGPAAVAQRRPRG